MYNYNQNSADDPQYQLAYRRAERRVKAKLGFYNHLAVYVVINGLLIVIYLATGLLPGYYSYPWFVWPMFGWGIGLLFHFLGTFVFSNTNTEETRQRMIEAEMRRMGTYNTNPRPGSPYNSGPTPPYSGVGPASPFEAPPDKH